jgi:hypothetical protein
MKVIWIYVKKRPVIFRASFFMNSGLFMGIKWGILITCSLLERLYLTKKRNPKLVVTLPTSQEFLFFNSMLFLGRMEFFKSVLK